MKILAYTPVQKKRASTLMALGTSEHEAASKLVEQSLFREAVVHLYFTCFYVSQALLCGKIKSRPSHPTLNTEIHKHYGRRKDFPRRYVKLHTELWQQRTEFDYNTTHTPNPAILIKQLRALDAYVKFALRVVPRVEVADLLASTLVDNPSTVKDFSFDVYCPKTYSHHTRLTFWHPPFYLGIIGVPKLARCVLDFLKTLRVRKHANYVIGINSKVNQYQDDHLVMLDIDAINPAIETALKPLGGVLLKSGRGYHFIGRKVVVGTQTWKREMRRLLREPTLKRFIDKDHVEISLRRGYATLRVTASPVKPVVPYFYKEL